MSSLIEKKGEKGGSNGQIWIQDCKKQFQQQIQTK